MNSTLIDQKPEFYRIFYFIVPLVFLIVLFVMSQLNFLLFHGIAEFFSIAVAWSVFILVWNTRKIVRNGSILFLGIALIYIGLLDLIHFLAYQGMNIFPKYPEANNATQLWISARVMEAFSLLLYPLLISKRIRTSIVFLIYTLLTSLMFAAIFSWKVFPDCYIDGEGLTLFKKVSEYFISLIIVAAIALLFRKRKELDTTVFRLMTGSMVITVLSELAFTFYINVYGISNVGGHFLKIISFFLVYLALVRSSLTKPYTTLFRKIENERAVLKESENRLRLSIAAAKAGSWTWNIETNEVIWDDRMQEIFGFLPGTYDGTYESWKKSVHPEDIEEADRQTMEALKNGTDYDFEYRLNLKNEENDWRVVRAQAIVVSNDLGERVKMAGFCEDITERKRSEEKLIRREQQYFALSENNPDNIMRYDKQLRHIYANQSTLRISGFTESEYIGKTHRELGYPDDLCDFWEGIIKEVFKTGNNHSEIFEWQGAKKLMTLEWRCIPEFALDGSVESVLAISRDITDRKHSEQQLAAEKERLAVTLRSIGDGVITTDIEGNIVLMNRVAETLTGWSQEEANGKPLTKVLHIINDQTRKLLENPIEKLLEGKGIPELEENTILISKDKTEYRISDSGAPIRNKENEITGIVIVFRDITEKLNLQEQLNHKSKMDAIGELAGGMAHDFNNVLNGILSASQLLKLPKQNLNSKSLKYVDMITDASIRAADLINKLLTFSRKSNIVTTTLNIHEILNDVVAIFKRTIDKKINISMVDAASDYSVMGDHTAIQSAFLNIGINASHAMPDGGDIEISTKNIYLDHKYCLRSSFDLTPGKYLQIRINDTGCGILEENLQKIFDPFYTTKEPGKGTGLGLSAVYGTIQDHRASIEVQSEIAKGTAFIILLPCSQQSDNQAGEISPVISGSGTILLVDDEELNRILNQEILEALGYKVLIAKDGLDSVEMYSEKHKEIDIVLMDMIMPNLNGSEAYYKMKEIDENCKVIIASGYTKDKNIEQLIKDGLAGFISKPYNISDISQLLAKIQNKLQ